MYNLLNHGVFHQLQDGMRAYVLPHNESDRSDDYEAALLWMYWDRKHSHDAKEPDCPKEWKIMLKRIESFSNIDWGDFPTRVQGPVLKEYVDVLLHEESLQSRYFFNMAKAVPAVHQIWTAMRILFTDLNGKVFPPFWYPVGTKGQLDVTLPFKFPIKSVSKKRRSSTGFPLRPVRTITAPLPPTNIATLEAFEICIQSFHQTFNTFHDIPGVSASIGNVEFSQLINVRHIYNLVCSHAVHTII